MREVGITPLPSAADAARRSAVPLRPGGDQQALFLVPGPLGQIFHFKRVAERLREDIPLIGLEALGLCGDQEPFDEGPGRVRATGGATTVIDRH